MFLNLLNTEINLKGKKKCENQFVCNRKKHRHEVGNSNQLHIAKY